MERSISCGCSSQEELPLSWRSNQQLPGSLLFHSSWELGWAQACAASGSTHCLLGTLFHLSISPMSWLWKPLCPSLPLWKPYPMSFSFPSPVASSVHSAAIHLPREQRFCLSPSGISFGPSAPFFMTCSSLEFHLSPNTTTHLEWIGLPSSSCALCPSHCIVFLSARTSYTCSR